MAQIHASLTPSARRGRLLFAMPSAWWIDAIIVLALVAGAYGIITAASRFVSGPRSRPPGSW